MGTYCDVVTETPQQVDVAGPAGDVKQGGSSFFIPPVQVLVPEDGAGLLRGAGLEELHELGGEGRPVLVTGTEDHVSYRVLAELPGHHVGRPARVVQHGGVGPGLQEEAGSLLPAQHGGQEERSPGVLRPLTVDGGSTSQQERDEVLSLTVAGKMF